MKKTSIKDKSNSQRTILSSQPSSSDSEAFDDYEEDQNIEEEKHSINGESQISSQEAKTRKKAKQIPLKNPTKKLRNQKKPRIVFNVSGKFSDFFKISFEISYKFPFYFL